MIRKLVYGQALIPKASGQTRIVRSGISPFGKDKGDRFFILIKIGVYLAKVFDGIIDEGIAAILEPLHDLLHVYRIA